MYQPGICQLISKQQQHNNTVSLGVSKQESAEVLMSDIAAMGPMSVRLKVCACCFQNEVKLLLELLPKYHAHVERYPHTLLIKFYGLHRVVPLNGSKVQTHRHTSSFTYAANSNLQGFADQKHVSVLPVTYDSMQLSLEVSTNAWRTEHSSEVLLMMMLVCGVMISNCIAAIHLCYTYQANITKFSCTYDAEIVHGTQVVY